MKSLHSFSRSESEIETARDREREVKMKKNSRETRISLVSATQLPCACSPNCFAHAPFTVWISHEPSPCARHCFAHAQAITLHMRAPLYRARPQFANMLPGVPKFVANSWGHLRLWKKIFALTVFYSIWGQNYTAVTRRQFHNVILLYQNNAVQLWRPFGVLKHKKCPCSSQPPQPRKRHNLIIMWVFMSPLQCPQPLHFSF